MRAGISVRPGFSSATRCPGLRAGDADFARLRVTLLTNVMLADSVLWGKLWERGSQVIVVRPESSDL